jgi:hypothetical protein
MHCEGSPFASKTLTEPEYGQPSASSGLHWAALGGSQPDRFRSKPGFFSAFRALGCGQVQVEAQQRPPHTELAHSSKDEHNAPSGFLSSHVRLVVAQ